jgi:flagellar M-ring protein FliF
MSLVQRVVLLTVLLACGGAVALLVGWVRTPSLALLYSGLEPEEASRIVEKVRDSGVPYELRSGGTAVYVPEEKVYALRLDLAGQGLPTGDQRGYKILDEEKIGTSPFTQRLNFRRAIEGEIARSIQVLEGVASARVHIVRPENSLFGGQEKASSATVVLKLKPGWRQSPRNIAAIIHLVAGSVEGLKTENVVVVDNAANLLSGNAKDEFARGAGTFLDFKTQHEEYLARKVEDMLSQVLGPGRATVRVNCLIDNSSASTTSEVYDPAAKVPTKEETKTKSASGATAEAAANGTTKEETNLTDYAVGRTVKHEVVVPGKVTSISVAAFVDLSAPAPPAAAADGTTPPAPQTPTVKAGDVETIIRNALGLKETDSIKVVETPFHRVETAETAATEETADSSRTFYIDVARQASLGVLVIGVLVALKIVSGPRKRHGAAARPAGALVGAPAGALGALPAPGASMEENPALLKSRITAALQENPEEVKRLFLAWAEGRHEGA